VRTTRPSRRLDAAGERTLADEPVTPHFVEELLLGDDPVPLSHQVGEDVEHLRLDRADDAVPAQLEAPEVELVLPEGIDHRCHLRRSMARAADVSGHRSDGPSSFITRVILPKQVGMVHWRGSRTTSARERTANERRSAPPWA
jgi:hypothetical protein